MSVVRTSRSAVIGRTSQSGASVAALVVLIAALADQSVWPRGPLAVSALLLGLGLIAGPVVHRLTGRSVHTVALTIAALASLGLLISELASDPLPWSPRWPELATGIILGLGLMIGSCVETIARRSAPELVRGTVSLTALIVLVVALAQIDTWPRWPLVIAGVLLVLGQLARPLIEGVSDLRVDGLGQTVGTLAAGGVLVYALAISGYDSTRWPELVTVLILGGGLLIAALLSRASGAPRERVLTARVDELSRTRSGALDVQASELRRIERDLHDGAQVRLVALSMKLGRAEERYRDDEETARLLREAREDATAAIRDLRELARGIAPPVLADRGLEAAVRSLAHRSGLQVRVSGELGRRPLPAIESAAYFVVAESLTNAAKHADGAPVEVRLDERGGDLFVEITDFGPGGANPSGGGLTGLRQRVEALDGFLHVTSPAGVGTQVEAMLPSAV